MSDISTAAATLTFRGAAKTYKTHFWQRPMASLLGLDLDVRGGEILGLLGPNGAGKTTAIKLALGLIFPDSGEVRLMGQPASRPAARARVGYLPENPYFPDDLTARELVEFAARLHGVSKVERRARADALLERVGLGQVLDRSLRRYSKGMVQRAGMARALVANPEFIILDEPMSGLDPLGRRDFRDLILGLKAQGTTVLFSSHVLADAEMLCDRVAILDAGRLAAVTELSALARERKILRWEVEVDGGGSVAGGAVIAQRGTERLLQFPPEATAESIYAALEAAGARPLSIRPLRETLEDYFLRALGRTAEARP